MIVRRGAKRPPAPSEAERYFHSTPVEVSLDYGDAGEPPEPVSSAVAEEMAEWLDDLTARGLAEDVTPHPLTDHIPIRHPSKGKP